LTGKLLEVADHLTAVELDATLAAFLTRRYGGHDNFTLHRRDVLTLDVGPIFAERPTRVVANLPYSAASAIVRHVLEAEPSPPSLTIMVQREVAERMLARPPEMSILGVATQLYAEGQIAFLVPPEVFIPAPTVESAVLTLRPVVPRRLSQEEAARLFTLVGAGFRHKRKNIANSMELELCLSKSDVNDCLLAAGIDPTRRAQTLSIEEWIGLARSWPDAPADP
jgi:16S rRNA (adenine1518-N6/adenine1519-N6)-dimethyltransferase